LGPLKNQGLFFAKIIDAKNLVWVMRSFVELIDMTCKCCWCGLHRAGWAMALALLPCLVWALDVQNPAAATPPLHGSSEHRDAIRFHRLQHLNDRINIDSQVMRTNCRYESDISTPPPLHRVALTFDDGPEPGQTELILRVLARYNIRATFFMIGEKAKRHPELVHAVLQSGQHLVGNHSWSHPNFHTLSVQAQAEEVKTAEVALGAALVHKLFRYPYGNASCETNSLLKAEGYQTVGWHVDSCDWAFDRNGAVDDKEALECGVLPAYKSDYVGHVMSALRAHRGGIVLMHEIHPNTVAALESLIQSIIAAGYAFGSVDDEDFAPSLR
jgi:peptidoglycan/xylan/chitin deacetylase (PgdA/CDA1 family)